MILGTLEIPTEEVGDTWQLEGALYGNGQATVALLLPFETGAKKLEVTTPTDEQQMNNGWSSSSKLRSF
jgi:hypothetical protein